MNSAHVLVIMLSLARQCCAVQVSRSMGGDVKSSTDPDWDPTGELSSTWQLYAEGYYCKGNQLKLSVGNSIYMPHCAKKALDNDNICGDYVQSFQAAKFGPWVCECIAKDQECGKTESDGNSFLEAMILKKAPTPTPAPPTPAPTPVPPTPAPPCVGATCTVMEDPHVTVFDGGAVSMLQSLTAARGDRVAADEKWLVKSSLVSIQARYTTDDTKANGSLFVRAVAVSGDFLKGNTLIIGSLQDSITWNGNEILEDAQSSFSVSEGDFFVNATRGEHSRHVEDLNKEGRGVSVELPLGVALTVNRLHAHVNVAITMPPQDGGQDGLCGNFNGITSDDSFELTNQRSQIDVSLEDSLFRNVIT